jgi:hypothetical protein
MQQQQPPPQSTKPPPLVAQVVNHLRGTYLQLTHEEAEIVARSVARQGLMLQSNQQLQPMLKPTQLHADSQAAVVSQAQVLHHQRTHEQGRRGGVDRGPPGRSPPRGSPCPVRDPRPVHSSNPNRPRRGRSAYFFFNAEQRPIIRKENPDLSFSTLA